ncbi:hypothetical protein ACEN2J_20480, partial [Pseudorhodobacter sp. W20_MBD10_FR17]|uniref:hypothetical protein n=1 Tax=Pseudorhodobacter sp. W20_MBD10_FR17 TaxID=3240266 RepID=UPI003F9875B7
KNMKLWTGFRRTRSKMRLYGQCCPSSGRQMATAQRLTYQSPKAAGQVKNPASRRQIPFVSSGALTSSRLPHQPAINYFREPLETKSSLGDGRKRLPERKMIFLVVLP